MRDDFLGEAEEHLVGIRQCLLQLENSVGKAQPDARLVEELFLEVHSFKGISAIVGLVPAEAVAHAMEDFLRLMRDGKAQLTEEGLASLTSAAQKLEQVVASFRSTTPLPGYESVLAELKNHCEQYSTSSTAPAPSHNKSRSDTDLPTRIEECKAQGLQLWKYTFTPTRELDASGTTVTSVREQLLEVGEILKAIPHIKGKGGLSFEFLIAARDTPNNLADWEAKGVAVEAANHEATESPSLEVKESGLEQAEHNPFLAPSHIVRVDLKRLDDLMRIFR